MRTAPLSAHAPLRPVPRQNAFELNFAPTPATITHAGAAHCGCPRLGVDAVRPSGLGPRECGPPPATGGDATCSQASFAADPRPTVVDSFGTRRAQLGPGVGFGPARHGGALASRLAAPPMDS